MLIHDNTQLTIVKEPAELSLFNHQIPLTVSIKTVTSIIRKQAPLEVQHAFQKKHFLEQVTEN